MMLTHIVATDACGVIGRDGSMPWHLSEDLRRFKALTMGHCMIMGRKTYDSIGKALPGRKSIVVTRQKGLSIADADVTHSIDDAFALAKSYSDSYGNEVFVIGGGELYRLTMPMVERIYLTRIHRDVGGGDTFYPEISPATFNEVARDDHNEPEPFSFITLQRR